MPFHDWFTTASAFAAQISRAHGPSALRDLGHAVPLGPPKLQFQTSPFFLLRGHEILPRHASARRRSIDAAIVLYSVQTERQWATSLAARLVVDSGKNGPPDLTC
ncbi:hypothetical protein R1flu_006890 [Riccia fluitans]|uniref:Uncharacterized protein n=1 Tax=Riccia fluitans TaxID=41844 RepID=A0ABD1YXB6_9MARC